MTHQSNSNKIRNVIIQFNPQLDKLEHILTFDLGPLEIKIEDIIMNGTNKIRSLLIDVINIFDANNTHLNSKILKYKLEIDKFKTDCGKLNYEIRHLRSILNNQSHQ